MALMSTRTHGLLDYVVGGAMTVLPQVLRCGKPAARLLEVAGAGAAMYSMLTDYEKGVFKVLPMEAHLAMDALSGATLIGASFLLKDESTDVRAVLAGLGAFEIAAAAMTATEPRDADAPSPAERIAEYVTV